MSSVYLTAVLNINYILSQNVDLFRSASFRIDFALVCSGIIWTKIYSFHQLGQMAHQIYQSCSKKYLLLLFFTANYSCEASHWSSHMFRSYGFADWFISISLSLTDTSFPSSRDEQDFNMILINNNSKSKYII